MIPEALQQLWKELAPYHAKLIAVSKTKPNSDLLEAYRAGNRLFGENKVQELVAKAEALPNDIEWHFIGHLQRNKVKYIAPFVALIHAVDSLKLLKEINKQGAKHQRIIPCLLQVHIAREEAKFGFSPEELESIVHHPEIKNLTWVNIKGLMGMATNTPNQELIKEEFSQLKNLFDKLKQQELPAHIHMQELSMGMSGDYKIALTLGSTLVRIGSRIFGARNCQLNA